MVPGLSGVVACLGVVWLVASGATSSHAINAAQQATAALYSYADAVRQWEKQVGTETSAIFDSTSSTIDSPTDDGTINDKSIKSALVNNNNQGEVKGSTASDISRINNVPDWSDPVEREKWFNGLATQRAVRQDASYDYQRRVLGTDIERQLVADDCRTSIFADAVTADGTAYIAWDAKHSGGGTSAIYEGTAPLFIQENAMRKVDGEMLKYREIIQSNGNPVNKLVIVTNTPKAQAYLTERVRATLGPEIPFEVHLKP